MGCAAAASRSVGRSSQTMPTGCQHTADLIVGLMKRRNGNLCGVAEQRGRVESVCARLTKHHVVKQDVRRRPCLLVFL